MKALVIGAGAVGARVARQLLSSDDVEHVVVRETDDRRADAVLESLGSDASRDDGTVAVDAAVLALPAGLHADLAADLVRAGVDVVSVGDAIGDVERMLDLDHEARERGRAIVVGAGFSPGLSCLLAAHAATGFDEVDEIHVARAGTGGPACAVQHHEALAEHAIDWRDGGWVRRSGGSGRELCWFPDPIGGRDCYRAALPDALLLVPAFPGVKRVTARLAATRRDRLTTRLPMLRRPHPEGGPGGLRVEVRGRRGTASDVRVLGAMDHPALAAATVAAVTARWCGAGRLERSGAAGLASMVEPRSFLEELRERGVRAAVFEGSATA